MCSVLIMLNKVSSFMTKATVNVLKFQTLFLFCSQIKSWVIKAGIHKMLVRIANREDPDQTASSEAV